MHEYIRLIGFAAGALTTAALIPQVIKSFKTRSTGDVSLLMFCSIATGTLLWFIYGLFIHDLPLVVWNIFTFALAVVVIALKIKHK